MAAAGVAFGGIAIEPMDAIAAEPTDDAQFGIITNVDGSSSTVEVQLDSTSAGVKPVPSSLVARPSVLYRRLGEGDRVAVTTGPEATPIATPLFMTLSGPIEGRVGRELTIQGYRCSIDDLSAMHDASGERNLIKSFQIETLGVGQNVAALCINNSKSGKLTVETLFLA